MAAVRRGLTQREPDSALAHPALEHHSGAESDRAPESGIQCARPQEGFATELRYAARQRPHAVCDGSLEPEESCAEVSDVDWIEVARDARVLSANARIDHEGARLDRLSRRDFECGLRAIAASRC